VAQAVALRHTLERARTRWPHCTGALYYKLNDNYPAASWSIADWYGAVKITHWFCKSAFAPLHACVLPESLNFVGQAVALPVFLLDDAGSLRGKRWRVTLRALDAALRQVAMKAIDGTGDGSPVLALGEWSLTPAQTQSTPLLLVAETFVEDALADRSYSFFNVEAVKDCLFNLLRTQLQAQCHGGMATVTNQGALAAVGVTLAQPGHADTFLPADNCFWLEPGESRSIDVNQCSGLTVGAWNADAVPVG
jgi:beta-mannosidase